MTLTLSLVLTRTPTLTLISGISFKFRDEMQCLVATLNKCEGHFIRCIKPNGARLPFEFDQRLCRQQLQSCGVLEAAKVSQAGYPKRLLFKEFFCYFYGDHALKGLLAGSGGRPKMIWGDARTRKLVWELAVSIALSKYRHGKLSLAYV